MKSKFDLLIEKYLSRNLILEKKRLTLKKLLDVPSNKKVSDYYDNDSKGGKKLALDIISKIKSGELHRLQQENDENEEEERATKQKELENNPPEEMPTYDDQTPETEVAPDEQEVVTEPNNQEEDTVIDEEESDDQPPEEQAKAYIARVMNLPWAGEDNVFQKAYEYLTKVRQDV